MRGDLVAKFGSKRGDGPSSKGLFIRAPEGTEVRAVAAGRVVYADWLRGFGNLIIVDHGNQYITIYGNNQAVLKRAGDLIKAGDVIASAGNSGGNEQSGLYFEMRHQGRAFDPQSWVTTSLGVIAGVAASMQFDAIAQKNVTAALPLEELRQLTDVFGLIKSDYVEPVEDKKLLTEAISGMVASLDPHSAYLDKKAYKELREGTMGKFVGLGIEVGMEDGYVKVISPIEDSPAYRAGIKAGDLITRLDTLAVKGLTLDEAVKKMRGEPNTKITLTIARKDEDKPIVLTITRQEIRVQSVKSKVIEPGYAWVRVTQFQEPTVDDMAKKIQAIYAQEPNLKGLVLDLRNDPGGVLPGAIGVSAAFLAKDAVVVTTNGQLASSKQ
eukprot:gene28721-32098_t